ncbi:MAG: response regulator [Xanthomonadales bacterium]|nr:response regulator [Xanthomonadales bacterium]
MSKQPARVIRTLIVDDESLARRGLELRLAKQSGIEIIGQAENGRQAVKMVTELSPELVFLDIQMPGMNGFEVIRSLNPLKLPMIIFVTAFDQYAIKAFAANAIDYLLKPIDDSRLHQALFKARERLNQNRAQQQQKSLLRVVSNLSGENVNSYQQLEQHKNKILRNSNQQQIPKLAIRDAGTTTWVIQDNIDWIDAAGDYMCVHENGKTHIMRTTMKALEAELNADILQRIHRSTIVNIHKVQRMQSHINGEYFLTLNCGEVVKLSRSYKHKLATFGQ